jgi:hypothetical protein
MLVERSRLKVIGVEVDADATALSRFVLGRLEEATPQSLTAMGFGNPQSFDKEPTGIGIAEHAAYDCFVRVPQNEIQSAPRPRKAVIGVVGDQTRDNRGAIRV